MTCCQNSWWCRGKQTPYICFNWVNCLMMTSSIIIRHRTTQWLPTNNKYFASVDNRIIAQSYSFDGSQLTAGARHEILAVKFTNLVISHLCMVHFTAQINKILSAAGGSQSRQTSNVCSPNRPLFDVKRFGVDYTHTHYIEINQYPADSP